MYRPDSLFRDNCVYANESLVICIVFIRFCSLGLSTLRLLVLTLGICDRQGLSPTVELVQDLQASFIRVMNSRAN